MKEQQREARKAVEEGLVDSYGARACDAKRKNYVDLGDKPFSILAFHNRFFEQIRTAFVMGAYYPALTAACALGERILNHLILILREDYRSTPEYKRVHRKNSFDDWSVSIDALESWGALLPEVAKQFRRLRDMRNKAIHFRPEVDQNDRVLALEAILCLREIVVSQFGALGPQPWFIANTPGEMYIRKQWETKPFIQKVYLPNCRLVGPRHRIETLMPKVLVWDDFEYGNREVTDDEFAELRRKGA